MQQFTPRTSASQAENKHIYTVSKLNRLAKSTLENQIGQIWLNAEVSNFVAASSGHWYFTLKDEKAQIRAAMFRGANRFAPKPKEGDKVLVRANISLYEPRGDYQLIVEHLAPEGEGALKLAFEQRKLALSAEGLFAQQSKQPLPAQVKKVGIVTSATGAALHDILTVLARRSPTTQVVIYPSLVQGEQAAKHITAAIQTANFRNEVDVLIVGRGGGSLEDLWCFNDEALARAIFASRLPIISAVGHEVDVTIADFVADLRAPTPSAAAELVSQDLSELVKQINQYQQRLSQSWLSAVSQYKQECLHQSQRLHAQHPQKRLQQQAQQLDYLTSQLNNAIAKRISLAQQLNQQLHARLARQSPEHKLLTFTSMQESLTSRLNQGIQQLLKNHRHKLAETSHVLNTVSPLATLARGYSISFKQDKLVNSVNSVQQGDLIVTKLVDGEFTSQVTRTN